MTYYKANLRPAWLVIVLLLVCALALILLKSADTKPIIGKDQPQENVAAITDFSKFKYAADNEACLKCHGQSKYILEDSASETSKAKKMYTEVIIDRELFYASNHREFRCTDCHSEDYATYPHDNNLRYESIATCIDCHGGDEKYAKFKFEQIESEFQASVHSEKHSEDFTCWMCHDPHTYKINARNTSVLKETILYDNLICLNCHADQRNYQLLTDKNQPNILSKHEWLPNQASHFTNVRCIECHARNEDTLVVAHHVVSSKDAVKKCEACHSSNSILYASLYKYQVSENIQKEGFLKGLLIGDATSIGRDESNTLNIISLVIFGLTLVVIAIHAFLRIKNK